MVKTLLFPGFLLLCFIQWLVPVQMILKKSRVLSKGTSYKFRSAPVDPSNPFIGKYIVLNFADNSIKIPAKKRFTYGSKIYLTFFNGADGFAKIKTIDSIAPQASDYLQTTMYYMSEEKDSLTVFFNYPFNRFYMNEFKAPKAETVYRERNLDSIIKVYALVNLFNGDGVVKNVYVNDSLISDVIKARDQVR